MRFSSRQGGCLRGRRLVDGSAAGPIKGLFVNHTWRRERMDERKEMGRGRDRDGDRNRRIIVTTRDKSWTRFGTGGGRMAGTW